MLDLFKGNNTCKGIKQHCPTCGSGFYSLSFDGEGETDVYCDMDVDQGMQYIFSATFTIY